MVHAPRTSLSQQVDDASDHVLGRDDAPITLVEYGSYACPNCRAANDRIADVRDHLGERLRYVFRHRPVPGNELARRAAELIELAPDEETFWRAHVLLMSRSETLTEDDLRVVAGELGVDWEHYDPQSEAAARAKTRVDRDMRSARASGVIVTPTFFINGRKYEGLWEESSFSDALLGSLGHRFRAAALDFASWAPSAGILLLVATIVAVALTNSAWGSDFLALWQEQFGFVLGGRSFRMSLLLEGHGALMSAIGFGLVAGKPIGITLASALAVRLGVAEKPAEYSWRQLTGAAALAGIGFTMSLFIAGEAFVNPPDFAAAKIAVFAASVISAVIGVAILWGAVGEEQARGSLSP